MAILKTGDGKEFKVKEKAGYKDGKIHVDGKSINEKSPCKKCGKINGCKKSQNDPL